MWFAFFIFTIYLKTHIMGRGDKKTKKGKIFKGSFGKTRLSRPVAEERAGAKKAEAKKVVEKKAEAKKA
jgi:30S ribosomal protein S31